MNKLLFLLSLLAIFAIEGNAQSNYKTKHRTSIPMPRNTPRATPVCQQQLDKAREILHTKVAKHNVQADPTMEVRRANVLRKENDASGNYYGLRLDSIVTPSETKRVITSDAATNRWTHEDLYTWLDEQWVLTEKIDYTYDMGGVTLTTYYQSESPDPMATRYTSDYDAQGNLVLEIREHIAAGGTEWVGDEKLVAKYFDGSFPLDAEMRDTPLYYEVWSGGENPGEWSLQMKYATEYDEQGHLTHYEMQQSDGTSLQGEKQCIEWDGDYPSSSSLYTLMNGEWKLTYKGTLNKAGLQVAALNVTYDSEGNELTTTEESWELNPDESLNCTIRTKQAAGEWYVSHKEYYTFDDQGAALSFQTWVYDEDSKTLVLDCMLSYTNDSKGHHTSSKEGWRDSDTKLWRDVYTYTYNYLNDKDYEEICFDVEENKYVEKVVNTFVVETNRRQLSSAHYIYDTATSSFETEANRTYTYAYSNSGDLLLNDRTESYGKNHWRSEYSYSSPTGKYQNYSSSEWTDGQLTSGYKKDFVVDDQERELTCTVTRYDTEKSQWYVDRKTEMDYDNQGNINHYRYYYNYSNGIYLGHEGYDIVVTEKDGLTTTAKINYNFLNPGWEMSDKSEVVKNQWGETVQTTAADYLPSTGKWFVREDVTYHFDESHLGNSILGGGKNHYMVANYRRYNTDGSRISTYYYSETVPEVEVSEDEPKVVVIDSDIFMLEIELYNTKEPDIKPIPTPEFEAVIIEEDAVVAVSIPAPIEVPTVEPTIIPIFFTPYTEPSDSESEARGQADITSDSETYRLTPSKAQRLDAKQTLVIKAGSISFNQLVYLHDIALPVTIDESILSTGISDMTRECTTVGSTTIYDLSGRPVTITGRRIYIKNGRKFKN